MIVEARVYYCFCGEMSQTKCDHCQQVSYCSDNCKQTDWCVHQNVCTGATSSSTSTSTSYSQPKKVKSEKTKRHLQNTTLSPYLTLVEPIAKKSSTRGKKTTKQSPRWQLWEDWSLLLELFPFPDLLACPHLILLFICPQIVWSQAHRCWLHDLELCFHNESET